MQPTSIVVTYPVTRQDIEATRQQYAELTFDSPADYAAGTKAIAHCRDTRTQIEKRRKALKADSLDYGRRVDAVAKELTALVESIERPLRERKTEVDNAKARAKAEAEAAERAAVEAQLRAEREAEEARLAADRAAEEQRLAQERERLAAERAALAEERRREDEARAEAERAMRAERDRLEAERRELERARAIEAERAAKAQADRDRLAAAERDRLAELERQAEHARRMAAIQPDRVKLREFAMAILALQPPEVSADSEGVIRLTMQRLQRAALELEQWGRDV